MNKAFLSLTLILMPSQFICAMEGPKRALAVAGAAFCAGIVLPAANTCVAEEKDKFFKAHGKYSAKFIEEVGLREGYEAEKVKQEPNAALLSNYLEVKRDLTRKEAKRAQAKSKYYTNAVVSGIFKGASLLSAFLLGRYALSGSLPENNSKTYLSLLAASSGVGMMELAKARGYVVSSEGRISYLPQGTYFAGGGLALAGIWNFLKSY